MTEKYSSKSKAQIWMFVLDQCEGIFLAFESIQGEQRDTNERHSWKVPANLKRVTNGVTRHRDSRYLSLRSNQDLGVRERERFLGGANSEQLKKEASSEQQN